MRCFVFSDFRCRYRLRLPVKEKMSRTVSCTSIDACGDDGRRDCRLAGVERCRNRTRVRCFLKHSISCVCRESSMREFQVDGRTISGYLAVPEQGSGPGVLVLHAWWGLTEPFRQVCDRLAGGGVVALAPDLYRGKTTAAVEEAQAVGAALGRDGGRGRGGLARGMEVLRPHTATHPA